MKLIANVIIILGLSLLTVPANAEIIAECTKSNGYSYFPGVGLNPKDVGDFAADAISNGRISLDLRNDGRFDVLFSENNEEERSSISEGAKVIRIGQRSESITIAVIYPRLSEVYTFLKTRSGPEVIWTTNKFATPVVKVGAYLSLCLQLNLPK